MSQECYVRQLGYMSNIHRTNITIEKPTNSLEEGLSIDKLSWSVCYSGLENCAFILFDAYNSQINYLSYFSITVSGWDGRSKRLKSIAVPSQNLPTVRSLNKKFTPALLRKNKDRAERAAKRLSREDPRCVRTLVPTIRKLRYHNCKLLTQIKISRHLAVLANRVSASENKTPSKTPKTLPKSVKCEKSDSLPAEEIFHDETDVQETLFVTSDVKIEPVEETIELDSNEHSYSHSTCTCDTEYDSNCKSGESRETKAAKILLEINEILDQMVICNHMFFGSKDLVLKRIEEFYFAARRCYLVNFLTLIKNDQQLYAYTGIDFVLLNDLIKSAKVYEGDSSEQLEKTLEERIILCLIKLRLNISFRSLTNMFYLTEEVCKKLFFFTLQSLKAVLKSAIYWPTKDEIVITMPESVEDFKKTTVVVDSNEVTVESPICPTCRLVAVNYEGSETLKFLLGFANSGLITYVGKAQHLRASNETVTDENYISKVLTPNRDAIMTDGVLMEEECNQVFIRCMKARAHKPFVVDLPMRFEAKKKVENDFQKAYRKFKTFKVLQSTIPCEMVPFVDDLTVVICGLVNLSNSIFANNEF